MLTLTLVQVCCSVIRVPVAPEPRFESHRTIKSLFHVRCIPSRNIRRMLHQQGWQKPSDKPKEVNPSLDAQPVTVRS